MKSSSFSWVIGALVAAFATAAIAGSGSTTQFKVQDVRILNQPIQTQEKPWTVRIYQSAWVLTPLTKVLSEKPKVDDLIEIERTDNGTSWSMTLGKVLEVGPVNENKEVRVLVTFVSQTFGKP